MTNGEKMQEIFPEGKTRKCRGGVVFESDGWCHAYDSDWWNAEYKEPTTKNDLAVDCISRKSIKQKLQEHHDFFVNAYGGFSNLPQNDKSRVDEIINCIAMVVNEPSVTPQPRKGHWIVQPSNKEQGERDFIWWKCSECGQVIFSETEKDRKEFHAFCGRCGADMREVKE